MSILVATDLSTRSVAALRFAEELAQRLDTSLAIVHVAPDTRPDIAEDARNALSMFLREYMGKPEGHPTQLVVGDTVCRALADAANGHELIVCGATGSSYLDDIFLGSTASRLIRESPIPVCVVPDGHVAMFECIAVPLGFDEASRSGLDLAAQIARRADSSIALFSAVSEYGDTSAAESNARALLEGIAQDADLDDLNVTYDVWVGEPAEGIRQAVERMNADIVVMGTHGRGEQSLYFLGSVAERIVRQPPCAVITTRPT